MPMFLDKIIDVLIPPAFAQAAPEQPSVVASFLPLIVIFAIFYFLLIRPQQKKQKEHQEMVDTLEVGAEVVTAGGVIGVIHLISDDWIHLEIAEGTVIKVQRGTIGTLMPKGTYKNLKS